MTRMLRMPHLMPQLIQRARATRPLRLIETHDPELPSALLLDGPFDQRWPAPLQLVYYTAVAAARSAAQLETAYWIRQCRDAELRRLTLEAHALWKSIERYGAQLLDESAHHEVAP